MVAHRHRQLKHFTDRPGIRPVVRGKDMLTPTPGLRKDRRWGMSLGPKALPNGLNLRQQLIGSLEAVFGFLGEASLDDGIDGAGDLPVAAIIQRCLAKK